LCRRGETHFLAELRRVVVVGPDQQRVRRIVEIGLVLFTKRLIERNSKESA
jgi:hypothetical protein